MAERYRTDDVFGVQRALPMNYVLRPNVDEQFVNSLTRDKHIVVHGSSKQGKTSLRKYHLQDHEYISVMCANTMTLAQLHAAILKSAGFTVEASTTYAVGGESKVNAQFSAELNLGISKVAVGGGADETESNADTVTEEPLELDPSDPNDVILALNAVGFDDFIVLEDFHYLPVDTQESFSTALKAFHEESTFTFIIVGVWLDENRLVQYNGDLTGRTTSVDADAWTKDELREVITTGADYLNICFDQAFVDQLIEGCYRSVHIVQEACRLACEASGISLSAVGSRQTLTDLPSVSEVIKEIVNAQSARHQAFLDGFADGFQATQLEMYRWILLPILSLPDAELGKGVRLQTIRKIIDANHPTAPVNAGNVSQALAAAASLQVKQKITPIILDYDQTQRKLNVVDRGFLTWLGYQDRSQLRLDLGLPEDPVHPDGVHLLSR